MDGEEAGIEEYVRRHRNRVGVVCCFCDITNIYVYIVAFDLLVSAARHQAQCDLNSSDFCSGKQRIRHLIMIVCVLDTHPH